MPREALIIGFGLIGGSAGIALRDRGWQVRYIDPHVAAEGFPRAADVGEDEIVLLATPVDAAVRLLEEMKPRRGVVTSACSVMAPLRAVAKTRFVAGHPLAGSEERGFAAARGSLFEGRPWFLDADDADVEQLVRDCGAVPERVDAAEHDRALALTSHLPQVLSTALAAYLEDRGLEKFAGEGLRTFLRLAGSDATVWKPVIEANRENLGNAADDIARLVREIIDGDPTEAFEKAQHLWRRL